MSHGDLLLVQGQSVRGRGPFAPTAVLIGQHGRFRHLHMQSEKKVNAAPPGGALMLSRCCQKHLDTTQRTSVFPHY